MAKKDWYDELTETYEFRVVQNPRQADTTAVAAAYLDGEARALTGYFRQEAARLEAAGWRLLTGDIAAGTTAILLVRRKRGAAH